MKKFFLILLGLGAIEIIGGLIYEFVKNSENFMTQLRNIINTLRNLPAKSKISLSGFIIIIAAVIAYFILSIVLYRKRHSLIGSFDSGFRMYFASFLWTAFLIAPVWLLAPEIIKLIKGQQMNYWLFLTPLYSVIPIIFFAKITKEKNLKERIDLFFFMIGIGITCPMFIIYKLFYELFTTPEKKRSGHSVTKLINRNGTIEAHTDYYDDSNKSNEKKGYSVTKYTNSFGETEAHTDYYDK